MRDLDAHSWVEVWFPDYGWVTRDPTPASAPPRSQPGDDDAGPATAARQGAPDLGGERLSDLESNRALAQEEGTSWVALGIARRSRRSPRLIAAAPCSSGAAAGAARRPRCGRWRSSSARCAARASTPRRA